MSVFQPMGTMVLVKQDESQVSEIIATPENMEARPESGVVVALGHQVDEREFPVGTRVVFHHTSGNQFDLLKEGHRILDVSEVRGFVVDDVESRLA